MNTEENTTQSMHVFLKYVLSQNYTSKKIKNENKSSYLIMLVGTVSLVMDKYGHSDLS